jgi:hypothetical protein
LDDHPCYNALSYTWGNPITVYRNEAEAIESAKLFKESREIVCNGRPILATLNLYEALLSIRNVPSSISCKLVEGNVRSNYVWIDALCINQSDIEERQSQVGIMDEIYRNAQMTIVWLGRNDGFTMSAVRALGNIDHLTGDKLDWIRSRHEESGGFHQYEDAEIDRLDWLSLYAFLGRSWFMRLWIIQEVVMSRQQIVLCGPVVMSWPFLVRVCFKLHTSKLYMHAASMARFALHGNSSALLAKYGYHPADQEYLYQIEDAGSYDPLDTVVGITLVRGDLGFFDEYVRYEGNPEQMRLIRLMAIFRQSRASEPRDKVYALIGILQHISRYCGGTAPRIIPDYTAPVDMVYLEAVSCHLEAYMDLNFLADAQRGPLETQKTLPSWMPDYSTAPIQCTRLSGEYAGFSAASGFDFGFQIVKQPTPLLRLRGFMLDIVDDAAYFNLGYNLFDIVKLLFGVSPLYNTVKVPHLNLARISTDRTSPFQTTVEDGHHCGVERPEGKLKREIRL